MLVKYYGLVFNKLTESFSPRIDFLSNGLFRMTQPKYLNDKGSEARLLPYFNKFSPADYAWAKSQYKKAQANPASYTPSIQELENYYLKPIGRRYGDSFPHMLKREGFNSMDEFDEKQLILISEKINSFLVEALSCHLGILSLSKSITNELMWTHYASEGKGLAVTFKSEHPFFKEYQPKDVNYNPNKRASLTYYKGMVRINGKPINNNRNADGNPAKSLFLSSLYNTDDMAERLIYSKSEQWIYENETRIVCPLNICEESSGTLVKPEFGLELPIEHSRLFESYNEINLKKIPFDAFESIVFGYSMSESDRSAITEAVKKNTKLSHLILREAKHNIYGELQITDLVN